MSLFLSVCCAWPGTQEPTLPTPDQRLVDPSGTYYVVLTRKAGPKFKLPYSAPLAGHG